MINAIELTSINRERKYLNNNGHVLTHLYNLNKINIFVGENNSGKSRLLRLLINNADSLIYDSAMNANESYDIKESIYSLNTYIKNVSYKKYEKNLTFSSNSGISIANYYANFVETMNDNIKEFKACSDYYRIKNATDILKQAIIEFNNSNNINYNNYKKVYIPVLRGVENFNIYFNDQKYDDIIDTISMNKNQRNAIDYYKNNSKHIYKNKVSQVYKIDENKIFTGENIYDDIANKLLGKNEDRTLIKEFQDFISKNFYDSKIFEIIPQSSTKVVSVKIEDIEHELYNLGEGIKQIIVILYTIFINKDKECLFFIEEPEINLHPGFQRKLIEILQSDIFNKHQYFITTHSNHLIDSCLDYDCISLYKFINNKDDTFKVVNTTKKDVEVLNLLGVNNSSVFMSNCTIWVEGISDKILIKKYLDVYLGYDNKYKEDIDYSFVEYGGNNITHWSFDDSNDIDKINAGGITNRAFIIVDNDNGKNSERKTELRKIFIEDNFYELKVREIENTISKRVLDRTLSGKDNPIIKDYTDYQKRKVYMGDFIDSHYNYKKKWSNKDKNGKGTGTINNKLEFSKLIAKNILSKDDLSKDAIELCEKIISFINNK